MAESIIQKAGGGAASDECTAGKAQVLAGYTAVTKDSGDEPAAGTMADRGAVSQALNCGGSYTIPAGYHNGSGKVTANSLASQTGGATAEDKYVLNGKTYWKDGVKRTGGMTVASVASFSVAPYSTSQVLATWKNPGRGPYSGVAICAKTGGYPANINDGRVYTGVGSNSAVNGTSSQIIGGLAAGTTYYFRIWVYCTCSAGDQYSGYLQTTCKVTAHGRAAFTSSGTWTVPVGVRSINVHCTGGGGGGNNGLAPDYSRTTNAGMGGAGGCTAYKNGISVVPGQIATVTVGSGGKGGGRKLSEQIGGASSCSIGNQVLVSALGGTYKYGVISGGSGGGEGGRRNTMTSSSYIGGGQGGSNGSNGYKNSKNNDHTTGGIAADGYQGGYSDNTYMGQKATTREFGLSSGTLYSGGGGGGTPMNTQSGTTKAPGGAGGGGSGGLCMDNTSTQSASNKPSAGSAGTGGGGGGNNDFSGENGGSGNVIITW